jgi:dolichyl-phosphooligosaccharide-protein glycotransferase
MSNQYYYTTDWDNACQWVDANTPQTSYAYSVNQSTEPQYGIMSWWDYGDYILYEAERPAIANNFQTGIPDSANFFIAQDEATADAIMDKDNARYVMLDLRQGSSYAGAPGGVFENMPTLAGQDANSYHMSYLVPVPYGTDQEFDGSALYYGTMYSRLFNGDGLGGKDELGVNLSGLQHYRLLYETHGVDPVKVFQYVKGATIQGNATPGATVEIQLAVVTPNGNETYYNSTTADPAGTYAFTVPYPTASTEGVIATGPAYAITSGNSTISVQVSQDAADNGEAVYAGGNL